jgi:predicted dehydrogenase
MDKLKVAIVGCGNIAGPYSKTLQAYSDRIEILGYSDMDLERAAKFAAEYGGQAYPSYEALLADPAVDVVVNLTIHFAHFEVTKQALEAGKHVHSEKPIALKYSEAKELVELAEAKGVRLSSAPITFMGEAAQTAWKLIREGVAGPIRLIYAEVNHGRIESWHPNPAPFYLVGPALDVGVYPLTIVTSIFGPVRKVTAAGKILYKDRITKEGVPFEVGAPDCVIALLELENGILVRLTQNFYVKTTKQRGIEFHGDEGSIYLGNFQEFSTPVEFAKLGEEFEPVPHIKEAFKGIEWARGVTELQDAINEGRPQRATGAQAAHVVEILEAMITSYTEGRSVEVTSDFVAPTPMDWAL